MKLSQLFPSERNIEITGIAVDSRKVKNGNVFICLNGSRSDGHHFVKEAIERGAVAVVTEKRLGIDGEITVEDTRKEAARLYSAWSGYPQKKLKIIGVTGTNGKTSVVSLLSAIYRRAGINTASSGTLGCWWDGKNRAQENTTAPPEILYSEMAEMVRSNVEYLVMEVSSHALSLHRVAEIHFAYGVYTNLTPEHLDFHKTMEDYAAAKEKLFAQSEIGIFNYDDKYSYIASQRCLCHGIGYGTSHDPDIALAEVLKSDLGGNAFTVNYQEKKYSFSSPLAGEFNRYNMLAAIAVALTDGIDPVTISTALRDFYGVKGRLEKIYQGKFTIFIDYAHTPDALSRVLKVLRQGNPKRLRVLFGCGGDRDRSKRPLMGKIAQALADDVIVTSDNARSEDPKDIIDDILAGMRQEQSETSLKVIEKRRMALEYAIESSLPGDVLLVAGKGHEDYEIDCSGRHSFSEKTILSACLRDNGFLE